MPAGGAIITGKVAAVRRALTMNSAKTLLKVNLKSIKRYVIIVGLKITR